MYSSNNIYGTLIHLYELVTVEGSLTRANKFVLDSVQDFDSQPSCEVNGGNVFGAVLPWQCPLLMETSSMAKSPA